MSSSVNVYEKFILGSAQLGMEYGINNSIGRPTMDSAREIIACCALNKINHIDTARIYGDSEEVVGGIIAEDNYPLIKVMTKLNLHNDIIAGSTKKKLVKSVDKHIQSSVKALQQSTLYAVLLHKAEYLTDNCGLIWSRIVELKKEGLIKHLGVSVQSPSELELALCYPEIEYIQLPYNILDHRWEESIELIRKVKLERKINIHVRSVYLQGLLLSDDKTHWLKANCLNYKLVISWLRFKTLELNRKSIADLCLAYMRSLAWIDGLVIGVESIEQLNENFDLFNRNQLSDMEVVYVESSRPKLLVKTLNPAEWSV
ncbi:MAG: hypothetical protein OFPI_07950 [Osedax symbiont Rs2]|nr:MAG: hypothetical protein OFPI_07950 [Osedax symbiont Rs2]